MGPAALFGLSGCGGETGGAPSGIAGALTNATLKVSSFSLTTTSAINDLQIVDPKTLAETTTSPPAGVQSVAGALYPTRNSRSFRVLLKGAGTTREDVVFYYNIFDPSGSAYSPSNPTGQPSSDGFETSLTNLYVARRPDSEQPRSASRQDEGTNLWPVEPQVDAKGTLVKDASGNVVFHYSDNLKGPAVPSDRAIYRPKDAFTYDQFANKKAVRVGRRNVVVQFFSTDASSVKSKYDALAKVTDATTEAAQESDFLRNNLTNSYVFSVDIQPKESVIPLTAGFQTNNGDNGLVDTNTFHTKVTGLPLSWGSVRFDTYEETTGFANEGIVYTVVVDRKDRNDVAETTAEADTRFANRQRVLKVYATCFEGPGGQGAILAQTLDYSASEANGGDASYNTPTYPVQFIPTALAKTGPVFPANAAVDPDPSTDAAQDNPVTRALLNGMTLATRNAVKIGSTTTTLAPGVSATVPVVARDGGSQNLSVTVSFYPEPRYANGSPAPARPATGDRPTPSTAPLFAVGSASYVVSTAPPSSGFDDYVFSIGGKSLLTAIEIPPSTGQVRWQTSSPGTYYFSPNQIPLRPGTAGLRLTPAALVQVSLKGLTTQTSLASTLVPVPLQADKGDATGTVG